MARSEATRELQRSASRLLRRNGNDPEKALRAFTDYLVDDATPGAISGAFSKATAAYADPDHDMVKDAHAYLVKLAQFDAAHRDLGGADARYQHAGHGHHQAPDLDR